MKTLSSLKNTIVALVFLFLCFLSGFAQMTLRQPTSITTWDFNSEYGLESPYYKSITLGYDQKGNLANYYHEIEFPYAPYSLSCSFTYDALNRLSFKESYYEGGTIFYTYRYYYSYDESSNLTECLVMYRDKYPSDFNIESKDIYQYGNGKISRFEHYVYNGVFLLQYYDLYDYSENGDWSSETKYNADGTPLTKIEYTYSSQHDVLTKTLFNWSSETGTWLNVSLVENEYGEGFLVEKRMTDWNDGEICLQRRQLYDYDGAGNCTQILFQTLMDNGYTDTDRAIYLYDEHGLCTNANAERWNDTTWVLGGFPEETLLFLDDTYSNINDIIGSIAHCTRAEVTDYVTTPNPLFINSPLELEGEWYYEIQNPDGSVTYQYLQCAGDTVVGGERPKIIVRTNTIYDKGKTSEITQEYVYESNDTVFWWNNVLQEYTVLYSLAADAGDEWEILVGTESLVMHVDSVKYTGLNGLNYRTLYVSDAENLFSGEIVCSFGHMTSFFPERLMKRPTGSLVNGLRCYWIDDALVYHDGDEDCDAIHIVLDLDDETTPTDGTRVYPNPPDGIITIESQDIVSLPQEYRITNPMGQTLLTGFFTGQTLDVSSLSNGIYFLRINDATVKLVVNR